MSGRCLVQVSNETFLDIAVRCLEEVWDKEVFKSFPFVTEIALKKRNGALFWTQMV